MRLLVRRYVTAEQRKSEEFGITEDDVMEIRQDISSMKFEMIDIFKQNGYKTPKKEHDSNVGKNKSFIHKNNSNLKLFNSELETVKIHVRANVLYYIDIYIGNFLGPNILTTSKTYKVLIGPSIKYIIMVTNMNNIYQINYIYFFLLLQFIIIIIIIKTSVVHTFMESLII